MSIIEFNGVTFTEVVDADGNPTRVAAEVLGRVYAVMAEAVKVERTARRTLMQGNATPAAYANAARAYADVVVEVRDVLRAIPRKTTARGGATPQTVWVEFFEGVDADLERNMTKADAKAKNKKAFR